MLGVAIYQQIRAHMLLRPSFLAYKSDNPIRCLQMCQAPRCNDLDALCRLAGVALLEQDDEYPILVGRESIVMLLDERMGLGDIDAYAVMRAFDADWQNTWVCREEMAQARDEMIGLPSIVDMLAEPRLHGGRIRLGGILPAMPVLPSPRNQP